MTYCLSSVSLFVKFHVFDFSMNTAPNLTKLGTKYFYAPNLTKLGIKHFYGKGILFYMTIAM